MSTYEALAAALEYYEDGGADPNEPYNELVTVLLAARERLAQLEGLRVSVWWCTEHGASFQQEAIPGPPTWDCWAGPIEDEHCVPILLDAFKAVSE